MIGQLQRIAHVTATAGLSEIESIRKVLDMQQQDNYRFRDHVKMLDSEVDCLKVLCENKQVEINNRDAAIRKLDATVLELKAFIAANKVDQTAVKIFSDQNMLLIEKLKEEHRLVEDGIKANTLLKDQVKSLTEITNIKSETSIGLEAKFTATMSKIRDELYIERQAKKDIESKFSSMDAQIIKLTKQLKLNDDLRREQVERSRQTEYKTMMNSEQLFNKLQVSIDEKEAISTTLELASFRGDMLQQRLTTVLNETDDTKSAALSALGKLEDVTAMSRLRERTLVRENDRLATKLSETTRSLEVVTAKLLKLQDKVHELDRNPIPSKTSTHKSASAGLYHPNTRHSTPPVVASKQWSQNLNESIAISEDETAAFDLVGGHQLGKQRLLARFMSFFGEVINFIDEIPYVLQGKVTVIDFSEGALTDDEFTEVLKWIRFIPLHCIAKIDFHGNKMSKKSLGHLFAWILSLSFSDIVREEFLYIDCRNCNMTTSDVKEFARNLNDAKTPGMKLVEVDIAEEERDIIVSIYGFISHEQTHVAAVIKIFFSNIRSIVKTPKTSKNDLNDDNLCYAFRRGKCLRGEACPFPHEIKKVLKEKISNVIEVPILDRFFVTSVSRVNVSSPSLTLPGLTADDRAEYNRRIYPRNSIMLS